jgi:hypothetical protein
MTSTASDTFKAEIETKNEISSKIPQCMFEVAPNIDVGRENMTQGQWIEAKPTLINKEFLKLQFPRTLKTLVDPPLNGQTYALVSFVPAKGSVPDADGAYGVLKIRGAFSNMMEADNWAENIIRNVDSYSIVDFAYVGKPFPLLKDNTMYCAETKEIDIRRKLDDTVKSDLKAKRDKDQQEMKEVQSREEALYKDVEETADPDYVNDLDYYVQLRTKKAQLKLTQDECIKKAEEINKLLEKVSKEIVDHHEKYPEHKDQFMDRYLKALKSMGGNVETSPLIGYMKEE